jgi:hypothetical protein
MIMSTKSLQFVGNVCKSCVVAGLIAMALVTVATLMWVAYLQ